VTKNSIFGKIICADFKNEKAFIPVIQVVTVCVLRWVLDNVHISGSITNEGESGCVGNARCSTG